MHTPRRNGMDARIKSGHDGTRWREPLLEQDRLALLLGDGLAATRDLHLGGVAALGPAARRQAGKTGVPACSSTSESSASTSRTLVIKVSPSFRSVTSMVSP